MNIFERSARFRWFNNGKLKTLISVNIFFFSHFIRYRIKFVRRIEYTSVSFFFSYFYSYAKWDMEGCDHFIVP